MCDFWCFYYIVKRARDGCRFELLDDDDAAVPFPSGRHGYRSIRVGGLPTASLYTGYDKAAYVNPGVLRLV